MNRFVFLLLVKKFNVLLITIIFCCALAFDVWVLVRIMRPYEKVIVDNDVVQSMIRTVQKQVAYILQGIFRLRKEQKRLHFAISYLEPILKRQAGLFKQLYFTIRNFNSCMTMTLLQSAGS